MMEREREKPISTIGVSFRTEFEEGYTYAC
jgi:hypothetical protein